LFDSRRDEEAGLLEDEGALHLPSSSHVIFHLTHGRHTNYGTTGMLRSNARAVELAFGAGPTHLGGSDSAAAATARSSVDEAATLTPPS
jgi:hypothetical protein